MVGTRKQKEDTTRFIPTPDIQLDCLSGYCITGHHDTCYFQFSFGKCGCDCHMQAPETQIIEEEVETEEDLIIIEDPRPWRNK